MRVCLGLQGRGVSDIQPAMARARIALVGDFSPAVLAHRAINQCFHLASQAGPPAPDPVWLPTDSIVPGDKGALESFTGFWCVPASPYRNTDGALWSIRYARENNIPFLGTCGGFQHALLEYARNVVGLQDADHTETNPDATLPLVARLECSLIEATQPIVVSGPGPFRDAYGADSGVEGFRCSYGLNPKFEHLFEQGPLQIAARSSDGAARGFALRGRRFFIGTLFQPERRALKGELHPVVKAFFAAAEGLDR